MVVQGGGRRGTTAGGGGLAVGAVGGGGDDVGATQFKDTKPPLLCAHVHEPEEPPELL